jgi:hypothetical protein
MNGHQARNIVDTGLGFYLWYLFGYVFGFFFVMSALWAGLCGFWWVIFG